MASIGSILGGLWGAYNNKGKIMDAVAKKAAEKAIPYALPVAKEYLNTNKGKLASGLVSSIRGTKSGSGDDLEYNPAIGDAEDAYGDVYGEGGYGGGYSRAVPDISGLLAAYDQQADASRKIAQSSYDTTRNDLLTSLKRFQEQNARDVANQKQGYLAEQSSLDYAREQANRQNRVAASARGLGGSGLQQLAQLQTLMSQSEDVSQAALSNQKAMDTLRQALQQKEDDTNSNLAKAQSTLDNALQQIEANLAKQKAETIWQQQSAAMSGGGGGGGSYDTGFDAGLAGLLNSFNAELATYGGQSEKDALKAINNAYSGTYGKANNLNQAKTILGSVFADAVASAAGKGTSARALQNTINQGNAYLANLTSKKKKK